MAVLMGDDKHLGGVPVPHVPTRTLPYIATLEEKLGLLAPSISELTSSNGIGNRPGQTYALPREG